jgi:hypothetical protein
VKGKDAIVRVAATAVGYRVVGSAKAWSVRIHAETL